MSVVKGAARSGSIYHVLTTAGVANQIPYFTGTHTVEHSSDFKWDGSLLYINGDLDVRGNADIGSATAATDAAIEVSKNGSGNRNAYIDLVGDDTYTDFGCRLIRGNGGANTYSQVSHRGTGTLYLTAQDAGSVQLQTSNTTRVHLDSSGNLGLGSTAPPTANGGKVMHFGDNAADPTMATNTAGLYAKDVSGTVEMFAVDEAANATQISPHDPKTGEWVYFSKNLKTGVTKRVNMETLVRLVEKLSGEKLFEVEKDDD